MTYDDWLYIKIEGLHVLANGMAVCHQSLSLDSSGLTQVLTFINLTKFDYCRPAATVATNNYTSGYKLDYCRATVKSLFSPLLNKQFPCTVYCYYKPIKVQSGMLTKGMFTLMHYNVHWTKSHQTGLN